MKTFQWNCSCIDFSQICLRPLLQHFRHWRPNCRIDICTPPILVVQNLLKFWAFDFLRFIICLSGFGRLLTEHSEDSFVMGSWQRSGVLQRRKVFRLTFLHCRCRLPPQSKNFVCQPRLNLFLQSPAFPFVETKHITDIKVNCVYCKVTSHHET